MRSSSNRIRCAQRLSASRPGSPRSASTAASSSSSAQRLSASRPGSRHHRHRLSLVRLVLNAFRHHGRDHREWVSQRTNRVNVLNAFRHHGRDHSVSPVIVRVCGSCAQRLSASRPGSPSSVMSAVDIAPSAQRLSASRPGSRVGAEEPRQRIDVLNAFRHHGRDHDNLGVEVALAAKCSTPFGITAGITPLSTPAGAPRDVLNAFRHHGRDHSRSLRIAPARTGAQRLSASRPGSQIDAISR